MTTAAFPVNPSLTKIAIAYRNPVQDLIADRVLPRLPTTQKFSYTIYSAAQGYSVPSTRVGRKSEPSMVDFSGTLMSGETIDYGLDDLVPMADILAHAAMLKPATGGAPSPVEITTEFLTGLVELDREIRVANMVLDSNNYAASNQAALSGSSLWSDYLFGNPLDLLLRNLDVPLIRPNMLVLGQPVWTVLRQHPKIVNAVNRSAQGAGVVSRKAVAKLLEIDEVIVGAAYVNTARKGRPAQFVRVWGKAAALLSVSLQAAKDMHPTFGFTAEFAGRIAGSLDEVKAGLHGGVRVRSGESVKELITCPDAAFLFMNTI